MVHLQTEARIDGAEADSKQEPTPTVSRMGKLPVASNMIARVGKAVRIIRSPFELLTDFPADHSGILREYMILIS